MRRGKRLQLRQNISERSDLIEHAQHIVVERDRARIFRQHCSAFAGVYAQTSLSQQRCGDATDWPQSDYRNVIRLSGRRRDERRTEWRLLSRSQHCMRTAVHVRSLSMAGWERFLEARGIPD